jgi:hypothetical protein
MPEAEMVDDAIDRWIEKALGADPLPMEIDEPEALPEAPPPTDVELQAGQEKLTIWQPSHQFRDTTEGLCSRCRSSEYFNRPQLKFLHDAYVLAEFIRLQPVESVRLARRSDQWPDGFVKLQGRVRKIEITSTHGGRKLGREYRGISAPTLAKLDPVSNWIARADSISKYLAEAIGSKSRKKYGSPCWLVVYLNINWPYAYDIRQRETTQVIAETKARYAGTFEAISILSTVFDGLWRGRSVRDGSPQGWRRLLRLRSR